MAGLYYYHSLLTTYYSPGTGRLPDHVTGLEPRAFVECLCAALDTDASEYAFGNTRLFFRAGLALGLAGRAGSVWWGVLGLGWVGGEGVCRAWIG